MLAMEIAMQQLQVNANNFNCLLKNEWIERLRVLPGSSEAYLYNRKMTKKTVIKYFRKSICQVIPLHYERSSELLGLAVNEYVLRPESMSRKKNLTADCYKGTEYGYVLPDGLTDMAKCYFNFPMVLSLPHFFGFEDAPWNTRLVSFSCGNKVSSYIWQYRIIFKWKTHGLYFQWASSLLPSHCRTFSSHVWWTVIVYLFSKYVFFYHWTEYRLNILVALGLDRSTSYGSPMFSQMKDRFYHENVANSNFFLWYIF